MKNFALVVFLIGCACGASISQDNRIRYDNYSVFRVSYDTKEERMALKLFKDDGGNFKHWSEGKGELQFLVSPGAETKFLNKVDHLNLKAQMIVGNVQELIDSEIESASLRTDSFGWQKYNTLAEIEAFLDDILAAYPSVTEEFVVGKSYEGRTIRGIKISYKTGNPGVFIESNIHANEWITSATATWLINEFLTSQDESVRKVVENHDWYIVPVLNVDGFVYTHEKDRMWRKTRQPSENSTCIGVDPNRNYNVRWMENEGASSNPCDWSYGGPRPLSEPEIQAMTDLVGGLKDKINVFLAFHCYSQVLLSPYGHTSEEFPPNYEDLMAVAKSYADAVERLPYGTIYQYGSVAGLLYPATGASIDFSYDEGIEISYTVEFRDTGHYGFILPPVHIIPNSEEALAGIMALLDKTEELGYMQPKY
ncbi:hypothetical protein KR018_000176 [Drosophila ironensis]|nr:hypothetical protein KR018_000176 [Drosophila ironensis]